MQKQTANIEHVYNELTGKAPAHYLVRDLGLVEGPSPTKATPGWTPPKKVLVPNLAPGDYRACLAAQAAIVAWEASGWSSSLAKCTAGQLAAGGFLELDLSAD